MYGYAVWKAMGGGTGSPRGGGLFAAGQPRELSTGISRGGQMSVMVMTAALDFLGIGWAAVCGSIPLRGGRARRGVFGRAFQSLERF